ncbi:MAG TPA: hypothetical protein VFY39_10755 [Gammaproteobacteria bacterium]|nr:hypothetical protein [Gammaproteobacteria bacterium]
MDASQFFRAGWVGFPHDPVVAEWTRRGRPAVQACLADPAHRARWLRCGGTWFVGANVFPNDTVGAVPEAGVPPLAGSPIRFIAEVLGLAEIAWDRAQISVCFPGYPQPSGGESEAAFRFRRDRDAAHVDGLRRVDARRRRLGEAHGFILGLPLTEAPDDAAPFVVWEGSHEIMRGALRRRLAQIPAERWAAEDLTDAYVAARRECFETCRRVRLLARPGEAYLVHRLALHGVAPWASKAAGKRAIAYFRPDPFPGAARNWWLERP